jgi:DNA-binding NarL/FixJ family response regulator
MISVLIVEDETTAAEALIEYVGRVSGFEVIGNARTGADALHRMAADGVDLLLLDIYLPDMSGLELLRMLRGAGNTVDAIAVTVANDQSAVKASVALGVVQYVVKPFTFNTVRRRLKRYQEYQTLLTEHELILAQQEIDHLLNTLRDADPGSEPFERYQPGVAARSGLSLDGGSGRNRHVRSGSGAHVGCLARHGKALPRVPRRFRARGPQRPLQRRWPTRSGIPAGVEHDAGRFTYMISCPRLALRRSSCGAVAATHDPARTLTRTLA